MSLLQMLTIMSSTPPGGGGGGGGGDSPAVAISDQIVSVSGSGSGTVVASITYQSTGNVIKGSATFLETWKLSGASADYEIRCTYQSGSHPTGTENTWLSLGSSRTWSLAASAGQSKEGVFLIQIRQAAGTQTILDAALITLQAENSIA